MSYLSQIYNHRLPILVNSEKIILECIQEAYLRTSKPEEPDFVAMLTMEGAPKLQALINRILGGTGISCTTTGVFCHQTPKAKFGTDKPCELGDILLAHIHSKGGKVQNRNSLLLQAKMAKDADHSGGYTIPPKDQHQLKLYKEWPQFEYYRSGPELNGKKRTVFPGAPHPGAQYLLIDPSDYFNPNKFVNPPPAEYPCGVWMPEPVVYPYWGLSEAIFGLLSLSSGRPFGAKDELCGWTQIVWDLLQSSLRKSFNRRKIGVTDEVRVAGGLPNELMTYCTFSKGRFGSSVVEDVLDTPIPAGLPLDGSGFPPEGSFRNMPSSDDEGYASVLLIETYEE